MGTNHLEKGHIKLSAAEYPKLRRVLVHVFNEQLVVDLATAERLHDSLVAAGKGKRGFDYRAALVQLLEQPQEPTQADADQASARAAFAFEVIGAADIERALLAQDKADSGDAAGAKAARAKPRRPLKKDFPAAGLQKTAYPAGPDGVIRLDTGARTVAWEVSPGKNAAARSRGSLLGKLLFAEFARMPWQRGTGGVIHGYEDDSREQGAGGDVSRIIDAFGPLGEQIRKQDQAGTRRAKPAQSPQAAARA